MSSTLAFQIEQAAMMEGAVSPRQFGRRKVDVGSIAIPHRVAAQQVHGHTETDQGGHVNVDQNKRGLDLLQVETYHLGCGRR